MVATSSQQPFTQRNLVAYPGNHPQVLGELAPFLLDRLQIGNVPHHRCFPHMPRIFLTHPAGNVAVGLVQNFHRFMKVISESLRTPGARRLVSQLRSDQQYREACGTGGLGLCSYAAAGLLHGCLAHFYLGHLLVRRRLFLRGQALSMAIVLQR